MSGEAELAVSAQAGAAAGELAVTRASQGPATRETDRRSASKADLKAKSSSKVRGQTERLALACFERRSGGRASGPRKRSAGKATAVTMPGATSSRVESLARPPRPPVENETWITGNQSLRVTGLQIARRGPDRTGRRRRTEVPGPLAGSRRAARGAASIDALVRGPSRSRALGTRHCGSSCATRDERVGRYACHGPGRQRRTRDERRVHALAPIGWK